MILWQSGLYIGLSALMQILAILKWLYRTVLSPPSLSHQFQWQNVASYWICDSWGSGFSVRWPSGNLGMVDRTPINGGQSIVGLPKRSECLGRRFSNTDIQDNLAYLFWQKALGASSLYYSFSCFVLTVWYGTHKVVVVRDGSRQMPGEIFILSDFWCLPRMKVHPISYIIEVVWCETFWMTRFGI